MKRPFPACNGQALKTAEKNLKQTDEFVENCRDLYKPVPGVDQDYSFRRPDSEQDETSETS